jgi:GGDEF domain-containing protein
VQSGAEVFLGPPGTAVVHVTAPTTAVRAAVRDVLGRISATQAGVLPVSLSASVGWVPPEIDAPAAATIERARAACDRAESAGGDRWERVEAVAPEASLDYVSSGDASPTDA